jgi:hypothetical protein
MIFNNKLNKPIGTANNKTNKYDIFIAKITAIVLLIIEIDLIHTN